MPEVAARESGAGAQSGDSSVVARRRTRALVMQSLYEADTVEHSALDVLDDRLSEVALSPRDAAFARGLLDGIFANAAEIDKIIAGVRARLAYQPDGGGGQEYLANGSL